MSVSRDIGVDESLSRYVVEKLMDLISFPTVNPPGRMYEECARYLANELELLGMDVQLIEVPDDYLERYYPYTPMHKGYRRYIVLGRIGDGRPTLHFNGHYDVVPEGSGWSYNPFKPELKDGKIYGRGATDMKGGIAAILAALKSFSNDFKDLNGSIEVAFVPDEESGGVGTRYLVEKGFVKPDYVVIGEGTTSKRLVIGHKGMVRGVVKVYGKQVHGSIPWLGDNAFLKASKLVQRFMELYTPIIMDRKTKYPTRYPQASHPSINLGGYAESTSKKDNTVPGEFIFSFDRRVIPEEDLESVVEEVKKVFIEAAGDDIKMDIQVLSAVEPSVTEPDSYIVSVAKEIGSKVCGEEPMVLISPGRNDAVFYTNYVGAEAINYGPGVDRTAHTPDEYTTVEELNRFVSIYRKIIEKVLG